MRGIKTVMTTGAALALAASAGIASAQTGEPPAPAAQSSGGGPSAQTITDIRAERWLLEQRLELARLRNELRAEQGVVGGNDGGGSSGGESDSSEGESAVSAAPVQTQGTLWVMKRYSRYGDQTKAVIASRFGEREVDTGDEVNGWPVTAIGPDGVVLGTGGEQYTIPFRDNPVIPTEGGSSTGGMSMSGLVPPPPAP